MKFYQENKLIRHERAHADHFVKEIRDLSGRLITYVYMGRLPILKHSPYYPEWIQYKESGTVRQPYNGDQVQLN